MQSEEQQAHNDAQWYRDECRSEARDAAELRDRIDTFQKSTGAPVGQSASTGVFSPRSANPLSPSRRNLGMQRQTLIQFQELLRAILCLVCSPPTVCWLLP